MNAESTPTGTPVDRIVMRLFQLSSTWYDKAVKVEGEWYNDAAAYIECADALKDLAKELMPRFECCWCRDHAGLPEDEYTWDVAELGGWCVDTNQPICKECKWAADDAV